MVDYVIEECPGQKPRRIYTWSTRDPKWVQLPDLKVQGESELIREYPDTEGDQARIFANTYATEKKVERINDL